MQCRRHGLFPHQLEGEIRSSGERCLQHYRSIVRALPGPATVLADESFDERGHAQARRCLEAARHATRPTRAGGVRTDRSQATKVLLNFESRTTSTAMSVL